MKIKEVRKSSPYFPNFVPIQSRSDYEALGRDLGVELRPYASFDHQFRDYLRVMTDDYYKISLITDKGVTYNIHYYKGFPFDFASVPVWLRGFLPNNDRRMITAPFIHDALFENPSMPFSFMSTNDIFAQVMKMDKVGFIRRNLFEWGVNTDIARKRFEMNQANIGMYPKFSKVTCP